MPKVSIILSSYNHADYIGESIQSILDQTFTDFELYIIDDCSTDDSWEVIKKFKDDRIVAIRNKENIGIVIRPEIINRLKGEYIAMAHCDDRWQPTKLEKQVKFLDTHPRFGACFTLVNPIDDDGEPFVDKSHFYYGAFQQENRSRLEWLRQFFYNGNVLCHPSVLIRMSVQKNYGLYTVGMAALPDEYRWIKICLHDEIYVYPEKLTDFRVRKGEGNTSGDKMDNRLRGTFEMFLLPDLFREVIKYPKKDFLMILPSAKEYLANGKSDMEYIFDSVLIDVDIASYKLYGLRNLWSILQNRKRRDFLELKYKFTNKDFVKMTGSVDIFNVIDGKNALNSTLFYDTGEGFNEGEALRQKVYVNDRGVFSATFNLAHISNKIKKIRFDPFEDSSRVMKDVVVSIDNKNVEYDLSWHSVLSDGYIEFSDGDPQFIIKGVGKTVTVSGIAKIKSND